MNIAKLIKAAVLVLVFGLVTIAISQQTPHSTNIFASDSPRFPIGG